MHSKGWTSVLIDEADEMLIRWMVINLWVYNNLLHYHWWTTSMTRYRMEICNFKTNNKYGNLEEEGSEKNQWYSINYHYHQINDWKYP